MVVEFFEVVVGGSRWFRWLLVVVGGCIRRSGTQT